MFVWSCSVWLYFSKVTSLVFVNLTDMTSELNLLEVSNIVITTTTLRDIRRGENIAALQAKITHW